MEDLPSGTGRITTTICLPRLFVPFLRMVLIFIIYRRDKRHPRGQGKSGTGTGIFRVKAGRGRGTGTGILDGRGRNWYHLIMPA